MKYALLFITILFCIQSTIYTQEVKTLAKEAFIQETVQEESYPIPGSHFLLEKEQKIREYFEQHPEALRLSKPRSTAWNFTVESTYDWWADSLIDGAGQYQVPSTCRAVGTNCYIFVENAVWGTSRVDQSAVDEIVKAFDNQTTQQSIDPSKGIFDIDVQTFGTPPDVDNDQRIIILILDIRDDYSGSGGYTAGYFYSVNEYPDNTFYTVDQSDTTYTRSNYAEIFYMDCNPADLITDRTDVLNTTAHEFQHMIHWAHDTNESTFVNEGLSEIASYICGYGLRSNGRYAQNTNVNLLSWGTTDDVLEDYSRAALWTLYMYEQFPIDIMKDFVDRSHHGFVSFNTTLGTYDPNYSNFFNFLGEWLLANYINDTTIDSKYGYTYAPIVKPTYKHSHVGVLAATATTETLQPYGAHYIEFSGGSNLSVTFTNIGGTIKIRAIKSGDNTNTVVEEIPNNTVYTPSDYGTTYNKVVFLIYNSSPDGLANYTYSSTGAAATGSMKLAYEDGEPEGLLVFNTGDSLAVWFSGISGAKLDSIKIAFRRSGRILVDICALDGTNFLRGNTLYGPEMLTIPDSTASVNPYPIPYDNWYTLDLTGKNIDVTNDFIVSSLIGINPSEPGIMVSKEPDTGVYHSRTYTENSGTTQWWIFHDGGTPKMYWNYLMRAYVSFGGTTVAIDQDGIVTIPNEFSLEQNYPNPFNPSTTFRFSTPKDGLVRFTVHDLLGRVVYSENRNLLAGNYSFTWEGQNQLNQQVVSGVYFLRMEAEGFIQTRKMLMMK